MSKGYEVDQHPQKNRIIKALVRREPYRKIKERYGISQAALSRYLNKKLLPQVAEASYEQGTKDGSLALQEVREAIERIHKMYRACDEYLEHPDKPGEYFLGPRADEILISYVETDGESQGRHTMALQDALNRLKKAGKITTNWRYKHADPRKLVLDTMGKAREQMEFLGKLSGKIQDVVINVEAIEWWTEIKIAIMGALKDVPDVKSRIVEALKELDVTQSA